MSSRLAFDGDGRLVAVDTSAGGGGCRWLVLGNLVHSTISGDLILFGWLGPSGRPPSPRERAEARPPYESNSAKRARREQLEVPDEVLADDEPIRLAMLEQRREPADLIQTLAA
jgi:hypothetical protein